MKTVIKLIIISLIYISISARAQMQTLVVNPSNILSSVITVATNQYAVLKSMTQDYSSTLLVNLQGVPFTFDPTVDSFNNLVFSGPATIQLQGNVYNSAYATIEVKPQQLPVPPNQTVTVGSSAGNVQVTMLTSTDLINWTPAVNGMVYTNTPDARFFRIQLLTNVQSP
ncbi:MAG: hypothetical protein ACREFE_00885 [Limisphaerales bacterium]